nr:hypothetical protein [Gammaproteobacteria bacterium]
EIKQHGFRLRIRHWDVDWTNARYQLQACRPAAQTCQVLGEVGLKPEDAAHAAVDLWHPNLHPDYIRQKNYYHGAVYIYALSNEGWQRQAYLIAPTKAAHNRFGTSLSLSADGNTIALISQPLPRRRRRARSALEEDALYIYARSGVRWERQLVLRGKELLIEEFGRDDSASLSAYAVDSVFSTDGNTLAVGYPHFPNELAVPRLSMLKPVNSDAGAVYIYWRNNNEWQRQAMIRATNAGHADQFGGQIALSADGNTLAVAASEEDSSIPDTVTHSDSDDNRDNDDNRGYNSGAVYIYNRDDGKWSESQKIKASLPHAYAELGNTIALSADGRTLAAGTSYYGKAWTSLFVNQYLPDEKKLAHPSEVARPVHVFALQNEQWIEQAVLWPPNDCLMDYFGHSLSLSADGSILAIGSYNRTLDAAEGLQATERAQDIVGAGVVYLYERHRQGWRQKAFIHAPAPVKWGAFGLSVAVSADGNTLYVQAYREHPNTDNVITDLVKADNYVPDQSNIKFEQAILYIY